MAAIKEIQKRWEWDKGFPATPANIRLAIRRTGNSVGITVAGKPYLRPRIGMRVITRLWHRPDGEGTITKINKPLAKGCDPSVQIAMDNGRVVYLCQTALIGYTPVPVEEGK